MTELITFTVVGLAIGSIYSIASVGLVVTYTTSGIFNFAHGAIGMFAAFIYWQLRWDSAWGGEWPAPIALAFVLLIVSPSLGILLQAIVRDNEACYSNCSYVGFHWDNKLGLARF